MTGNKKLKMIKEKLSKEEDFDIGYTYDMQLKQLGLDIRIDSYQYCKCGIPPEPNNLYCYWCGKNLGAGF